MPYISAARPAFAVTSSKVPSPRLRYRACVTLRRCFSGQAAALTRERLGGPAPSESRNASPEPIGSGRDLFPEAPPVWGEGLPAARVTGAEAAGVPGGR